MITMNVRIIFTVSVLVVVTHLCHGDYGQCIQECSTELPVLSGLPGPKGEKGDPGNCRGAGRKSCRNGISMGFPRQTQTSDSIRVLAPFPTTTALTFCARINFGADGVAQGTVVSYSTTSEFNAFLYLDRVVAFMHTEFKLPVNFAPSFSRQHMCLTIDVQSQSRIMKAYLNGKFKFEQELTTAGATLPSGGYFIVGQEQDSLMGSYDSSQAYYGEIDNMAIWGRVLDENEIADVSFTCACNTDADFYPTENNVQLSGAANIKKYHGCV